MNYGPNHGQLVKCEILSNQVLCRPTGCRPRLGQDIFWAGTFWGVLNVTLTVTIHGEPQLSSTVKKHDIGNVGPQLTSTAKKNVTLVRQVKQT